VFRFVVLDSSSSFCCFDAARSTSHLMASPVPRLSRSDAHDFRCLTWQVSYRRTVTRSLPHWAKYQLTVDFYGNRTAQQIEAAQFGIVPRTYR
jgi:hypothetical protein